MRTPTRSLVLASALVVPLVSLAFAGSAIAQTRVTTAPMPTVETTKPLSTSELPGGSLRVLTKTDEEPKEFPLRHTDVRADIAGNLTQVTVRQEFVNPYTDTIEAIYVFPLPEDAAVNRMEMHIGNRVVKAIIKTREEARAVYEEAKREGRRAGLLEQERLNIFTQLVANIRPGETITIELAYVAALVPDDGMYTFVFPTVVGPRYIPGEVIGATGAGWAPDTNRVPDASRITPPVLKPGERSGHDIDIMVTLDAGFSIADLRSIAHEVTTVRPSPTTATVSLQETDRIPNKDFILRWRTNAPAIAPTFLAHRPANGEGSFLLLVQPPETPKSDSVVPKEIIFIVDTSGSMTGQPLEKVQAAMRYALQYLNPNDTFTILSFESTTDWFSEKPVPATAANIAAGIEYIAWLEAGGGTEMLRATTAALRLPKDDPTRIRIVSLMSDGYVGNERQILTQVEADLNNARLFPFGVGSSVNRHLITAMAQAGRGYPTFVTLREDDEAAVRAFYDRIAKPLLTNIRVDWGDLSVTDVVPAQIPDLFAGQIVAVVGKYMRPGSGTIRISGSVAGQPVSFTQSVVLPEIEESHAAIPTVWARWRIAEIENDYRMATPEQQSRITDLGLRYTLVTTYTSFVAVEELPPLQPGKLPRQVPVPVELPEGVDYEGVFGESTGGSLSVVQPIPFIAPVPTGLSLGGRGGGGDITIEAPRERPANTKPPDTDPTRFARPEAPRGANIMRSWLLPLIIVMVILIGAIIASIMTTRGRTPKPPTAPPPPLIVPPTHQ